jgi:hypothetical protein
MKKSIYVLAVTLVIATLVISSTASIPITKNTKKDDLTPKPLVIQTDYFSISGGAFNPEDSSLTYSTDGCSIGGNGKFYAPVYLPNEATVTKILFFWTDYYGSDDGTLQLKRHGFGNPTAQTMAEASTSGSTGSGASEDITIDNPEINNSQYSYFVVLDFPSALIKCYNVIIEYNYEVKSASENSINDKENRISNVDKNNLQTLPPLISS